MKSIKNQLTLATCSLLTQQSSNALAIENAWEIDSSALYYSEADDRVSVAKFVVGVGGDVTDRDRVYLLAVLDTMSGSTPSGAVKTSNAGSTTTGASGGGGTGVYDPNANALAKFDDTRLANLLNWSHGYDNNWTINYNAAVSTENDYRSFSLGATVDKETAAKDYRFTLGLAVMDDRVFRVGAVNTPVPLSQIANNEYAGEGEKTTTDLIFGVTHVINRRTIAQVNLAYTLQQGYLTDPYKVFSVVDINTDLPIPDSSYYEGRPGDRQRASITFQINHQLYPSNNILHASYRYYTDDWEVESNTLDLNYRFNFVNTNYLETSIRLYQQTSAYFYQNEFYVDYTAGLDPATLFPDYLSADYRLDDMTSVTPEIRYGREVGNDGHLRARLAYMYQSFEHSEFDTNKAIIFQIAYSKLF
jgi:hypothetical protein